uniref:Uncharacterized protein n=1 Tax=Knipowitschia caucasica TaxID=637954 RepID=A0AAV2JW45_KNICA
MFRWQKIHRSSIKPLYGGVPSPPPSGPPPPVAPRAPEELPEGDLFMVVPGPAPHSSWTPRFADHCTVLSSAVALVTCNRTVPPSPFPSPLQCHPIRPAGLTRSTVSVTGVRRAGPGRERQGQ